MELLVSDGVGKTSFTTAPVFLFPSPAGRSPRKIRVAIRARSYPRRNVSDLAVQSMIGVHQRPNRISAAEKVPRMIW